jgi:DNA polymerase epsilon subunit 4
LHYRISHLQYSIYLPQTRLIPLSSNPVNLSYPTVFHFSSFGPTNSPSPVARVQKIIHADPERLNVSKNAAFAIALATEMFIQHLATTTHNVVKTERKPRRNIQYRDVSSAIAKTDNLEFAVDVVPKTTTYKEAKKRNKEREDREKGREKEPKNGAAGQKTLDGKVVGEGEAQQGTNGHNVEVEENQVEATPNGDKALLPSLPTPAVAAAANPEVSDAMDVDERVEDSEPEDDPAAMQLEMEMRGPPQPTMQSPELKTATAATTTLAATTTAAVATTPPATTTTTTARRSTGGFTSINGAK